MQLLEHEKRFQTMELSARFHAVSVEICRDYPRAFMRAHSVATLLMDVGAQESDVVLGMVCSTGAWRSVEIRLSEAKAAGRIRIFFGVVEEEPEYEQYVMEDSQLTSEDRLIVDAIFACRLREAIDYYSHKQTVPMGREAEVIEDLINRYFVAREYLGETLLSKNVDRYLRDLAALLPCTPLMLLDECDVYCLKGSLPPILTQIVDCLGFYRYQDAKGLFIAGIKLQHNEDLLRLVGLMSAHWVDLEIKKNPCAFSAIDWYRLDDEKLDADQRHARDFCQKLFALAPNPFNFEAFMVQVRYF